MTLENKYNRGTHGDSSHMLSTVVLSNENQTCRGWEAPTATGGGGCHECQVYFGNYLFINILKYRINIYISCVNKNNKITFVEIIFRIKSAKNTIPAKLKKVINRLKLSQKYFL